MSRAALTDGAEIERLARRIEAAPADAVVAWDTETNAPRPSPFAKPELQLFAGAWVAGLSVSLVTPQDAHEGRVEGDYVPIAHRRGNAPPEAVQRLLRALHDTDAWVLEHHGIFDRWGVAPIGPLPSWKHIDTQVVSWLQDENRRKGLKPLMAMLLGEDADQEARELGEARLAPYGKLRDAQQAILAAFPEMGKELKNGTLSTKTVGPEAAEWAKRLKTPRSWSDLTVDENTPYAARDATGTYEVAHELLGGHDRIVRPSPELLRELKMNRVAHDMTVRGIGSYPNKFREAESLYQQRADGVATLIDKEFGDRFRITHPKHKGMMNVGSNPTIEWLLYDHLGLPVLVHTDEGNRSVSKEALAVHQGNEVVRTVLEYRHWAHAVGSYARPFGDFAERAHDERIHGHFSTTQTVTGRMAASNPNVMTIPRDNTLPEIRNAMSRVDPGFERTSFDLASAELWVTASITRDKVLTAALLEGRSLHLETMQAVWGFQDKESPLYTIAKNVNYSMAYEAGVRPVAIYCAAAGYDHEESKRMAYKIIDAHKQLYRGMHSMSEYLTEQARVRGKLPLHVPGRYRHFNSPGRAVQFYTALNALVQGGIGEYMKDVMLAVYERGYGDYLILQVHDELVFDHPIGMAEEIHQVLRDIADEINPFKFVIPWDIGKWHG